MFCHLNDYVRHTKPVYGLQRQYNPRGLTEDEYNPRVLNGLEVLRTCLDLQIPENVWTALRSSPDFFKDEEQIFWNCLTCMDTFANDATNEEFSFLQKAITAPVEDTEYHIRNTSNELLRQCLEWLVKYQKLSPPTFEQFCVMRRF